MFDSTRITPFGHSCHLVNGSVKKLFVLSVSMAGVSPLLLNGVLLGAVAIVRHGVSLPPPRCRLSSPSHLVGREDRARGREALNIRRPIQRRRRSLAKPCLRSSSSVCLLLQAAWACIALRDGR